MQEASLDLTRKQIKMGSLLQDFDVKRLYYGRHNKPDMDNEGVELLTDLDEFLKRCDIVSINLPLSDKTK